ncbi:R3H domain-containing protein 2-like isoform X2 [Abrus precatorius]|uniref:R3H domain-containing protein 2-like isoform X2 n=1 Tax=Abrus precatorius TaxID=3816 RepID=A0A8B8M8R0_ABRPR|nr:R3H domain-containing protein 2-like isoform X2 [Abrus precatorius]
MEGSAEDLGAPESWEVADLDESMNRLNLILSSNKDSMPHGRADDCPPPPPPPPLPPSGGDKLSDDVINQVDQFLREAIQNPRERLSILRMEQDVENFIRDPNQQQLEFKQLPTSYLRLAAHRVAQHYSLPSMVLLDNSLPDGSGSRIIVRKTSECKLPVIRLADIPVKLSSENNAVMKVAIKQRPQKRNQVLSNANSNSVKNSNSKSVEERKEEYNRARARIFSSSNNGVTVGGKPECESRQLDNSLHGSLGVSRVEDKSTSVSDVSSSRGLIEPSTNTSRGLIEPSTNTSRARSRTEKEPVGRNRQSNRVAIFRDREVDRKDPDYDRSYDRYMQRFDPGFGFNGGSYTVQPMYTAVLNYNTEFPQLGSAHRPQLSTEHQPRPLPQHIPGPWAAQSTPAGIGYGHPETMMSPFNPSQVGAPSSSTMYLHSSQYPCQRPGMPFIHHEHVHQPFAQSHQPPPDASFGLARPR